MSTDLNHGILNPKMFPNRIPLLMFLLLHMYIAAPFRMNTRSELSMLEKFFWNIEFSSRKPRLFSTIIFEGCSDSGNTVYDTSLSALLLTENSWCAKSTSVEFLRGDVGCKRVIVEGL